MTKSLLLSVYLACLVVSGSSFAAGRVVIPTEAAPDLYRALVDAGVMQNPSAGIRAKNVACHGGYNIHAHKSYAMCSLVDGLTRRRINLEGVKAHNLLGAMGQAKLNQGHGETISGTASEIACTASATENRTIFYCDATE